MPSRCSREGARPGAKASSFGSRTEVNSCGTMASTQKTPNSDQAEQGLAAAAAPRPTVHRRPGAGSAGGPVAAAVSDEQCCHRGYPFARARGSSQAIAKSQSRTATRTATVNSMNRACMSG